MTNRHGSLAWPRADGYTIPAYGSSQARHSWRRVGTLPGQLAIPSEVGSRPTVPDLGGITSEMHPVSRSSRGHPRARERNSAESIDQMSSTYDRNVASYKLS